MCFTIAGVSHAQFVHAAVFGLPPIGLPQGSAFATAHGTYPTAGVSAVPIFTNVVPGVDAGYMRTPGGGFPVWNPAFVFVSSPTPIPNVPAYVGPGGSLTWITAAQPAFGFGGASTVAAPTLNGGVAVTTFLASDTGALGGTVTANLFTTATDYVNTGPAAVFALGHGTSVRVTLGAPGDFACVGLNMLIEVGTGIGSNFVPTGNFNPPRLYMGTDGAGGLADVSSPGAGPGLVLLAPNIVRWTRWSTVPVFVPAGATVRLSGSIIGFLDPAGFEFDEIPPEMFPAGTMDLGMLASTNAVQLLPGGCDSIDFNNDTSLFDPIDIDAFLSTFAEGPCIPASATCNDIDFNNDGSLFDPCDIDAFLVMFGEGPCTLCGL